MLGILVLLGVFFKPSLECPPLWPLVCFSQLPFFSPFFFLLFFLLLFFLFSSSFPDSQRTTPTLKRKIVNINHTPYCYHRFLPPPSSISISLSLSLLPFFSPLQRCKVMDSLLTLEDCLIVPLLPICLTKEFNMFVILSIVPFLFSFFFLLF